MSQLQPDFGLSLLMQDVLDPSYRKALALGNDKFFTNFDLAAQDILATVKTVMMPDATSIRAELYKLNIYRLGLSALCRVDSLTHSNYSCTLHWPTFLIKICHS
jgi:hypothetical protein